MSRGIESKFMEALCVAKDDVIEDGKVVDTMPNAMFYELENGHQILAIVSGKI